MSNSRYVNPLTDFGFKKNFGDAEVMKAFLTDLLGLSSEIKEITHLDKERLADRQVGRGVVFDLLCKTADGSRFIVEMQKKRQRYFAERMVFYLSREVTSQAPVKDKDENKDEVQDKVKDEEVKGWDYNIMPVYGVFFLDFHLPKFKPNTFRTIEFIVKETGEVLTDKVKAFTLELPSYNGKPDNECKTQIDYWLYNLANMETMQTDLKFKDKQPVFEKMQTLSELSQMTEDESRQYFWEQDYYRTLQNADGYSYELGEEKGKEEGLKQGLQQGLEQGLQQGLQQGFVKTAINMKRKGFSVADIVEVTGLTEEEISKL